MDNLNLHIAQIEAAADGFAALAPAFETARKSIIEFGRELYVAAEQAYLSEHAKLPGSIRNARLAKKQHDIVWRWFIARMEAIQLESR